MYDAVNKGFSSATGDVYAYINADDFYLPNAFSAISNVFKKYPAIAWVKGITNFTDEESGEVKEGYGYIYNQNWIQKGIYGRNAYFIQQDSVFWKSNLWKQSGEIQKGLRYAGDYYLWLQFSKYSPLISINKAVSCFRKRSGQLSGDMKKYRLEQLSLSQEHGCLNFRVKLFFWIASKFQGPRGVFFFKKLYPVFYLDRQKQYIDFHTNNEPILKSARTYLIS